MRAGPALELLHDACRLPALSGSPMPGDERVRRLAETLATEDADDGREPGDA